MKINTFFYAIKQGIKNIAKNKMFSLASVATMSACIFLFGIFYIVITNVNSVMKSLEDSVAVTVFFDEGISDDKIASIGDSIRNRVEVRDVVYVSAEEAWDNFKTVYFEGHEDLADGFANDNPLANSANYQIYLNDVSMQETLVNFLTHLDGVRDVKQSEDVANTFDDVNHILAYISGGIILILLCVAIFLISNTIAVGISVRKEEIAIMKLIGATDFLVRAPFVVEGIVIGLIGAGIPLLLLDLLYAKIVNYIAQKYHFVGSMVHFVSAGEIFQILVPVALILGVGIGFVGSKLTIHKHLRV